MGNAKTLAAYDRPFAPAGSRVGLLGGSFDPAHAGHVHISKQAIKKFDLDAIWWLASPGNPLKENQPASMVRRIKTANDLINTPKITVSDFEGKIGTRYTSETLAALLPLYPKVSFVWLMGADNLPNFHHWQDWRWIMENIHVGVLARPGDRMAARCAKAADTFRQAKLGAQKSRHLLDYSLPRWCFVNVPMVTDSSTKLRNSGKW